MVGSIEEVRRASRAQGPATIMAVGTANPPHSYDQSTFPDYYFRVTNSEHMTQLKDKMRRICERSAIKKRYMHLTEDILKRTPKMTEYEGLSLNSRQEMLVTEVPKLGKEAAAKAIEEWGQPKSKITHLVFCTSSTFDMPGADYQLLNLLDLSPWVQRFMLYSTGCYGTGSGLRLAKDLAENNKGARVLVVWVDITVSFFHGPSDTSHDILVSMSLFGDGAASCVVGSDLIRGGVEKPVFEIFSASQTLIPGSGYAITIPFQESGLTVHLHKDLPGLVSKNIEKILVEAFKPLGISDWNSLFWLVHPGGRKILDKLELELDLEPKKLRASRHILSEYGNMTGPCAMFVLDEMRNKSAEENLKTNGEGLEWGVLLAFGPGVTVETLVLHSVPR